jgi:phosphoesterase RecJ-like protein
MQQTDFFPAQFHAGAKRMAEALAQVDKIIVAGHVNPDGDALGSMAAAGHILRALGKEFMLYAHPGIPQALSFLSLPAGVHSSLAHPPFIPQAALLLDCNEAHRLGQELAKLVPDIASINIDHHLGEGMGSTANWIAPEAAATSQLMAYVAHTAGIPLRDELATAIALGLITDTGGFCHENTSSYVLALAAHLVAGGCDISLLRQELENGWSMGRMRLWGLLMTRVRLEYGGNIAICPVYLEDLRSCQALKEDLEGFVEQMRRLRGVKVAALLREDAPRQCKISLRSYGPVDVRSMAMHIGGGGHLNAAGATLLCNMEKAQSTLLETICTALAQS